MVNRASGWPLCIYPTQHKTSHDPQAMTHKPHKQKPSKAYKVTCGNTAATITAPNAHAAAIQLFRRIAGKGKLSTAERMTLYGCIHSRPATDQAPI